MDIMLTVGSKRKKELLTAIKGAKATNDMFYWSVARLPKNISIGDNMYFVVGGEAIAVATYHRFRKSANNRILLVCMRPKKVDGDTKLTAPTTGNYAYIKPERKTKEKVISYDDVPF